MEPTIPELLQAGVQLMVAGMAIVFFFLALLVGAISILPRVLQRVLGEEAFEQVAPLPSVATPSTQDPDSVEAIRQAIQLYENNQ